MDLSPYDQNRCDRQLCEYGNACNIITLFLTLILISGFVQAEMTLDRLIVDFQSDSSHHQDIKVFNQSASNLYVNVSVLEVLNPGTKQEQRVVVKDIKKLSLIATPEKLIVPGNSRKNVRLVALEEPGKQDRIYRVGFTPAVGKLKARVSGIKLLVAYQALVIIRPEKPEALVSAERKGSLIVFRNTGNTNVLLQNGKQCDPIKPKECKELESRRLYAGNEWALKAPYAGPVQYQLSDGNTVSNRSFGGAVKSETAAR